MATASTIQNTSVLVGLIAVLCAAVLAVLVARSLTRPIVQLTAAVEGAGRNGPVADSGRCGRRNRRAGARLRARDRRSQRQNHRARARSPANIAAPKPRATVIADARAACSAPRWNPPTMPSSPKSLDGTITGWNPAAERLFGFTAAEAVGKDIDLIVPPDRRPEVRDILSRIGRGERIEHHETVRLRKDGSPVEVSLSISPIRTPSGAIIGASKTARDITEARKTRAGARPADRGAAPHLRNLAGPDPGHRHPGRAGPGQPELARPSWDMRPRK